ncbi:uncharacterized protein LOC142644814 [Dermatophagoides pteronyssinus]|uniref:uncharacterized protein LOC142644814 n=1 Tax=Dermatophagoides pteronyssinus TaxID=6956 RepID=UPI003F66FE47
MVEDPQKTGKDIGDSDTIGRLPKELQEKVSKILSKSPKEMEKPKDISTKKPTIDDDRKTVMPKPSDDKQQKKESKPVEKSESQKDDDDKKRPKKLIRIILRKPNGDEQIEDLLIDPDTKPEDINDTIKQELQNVLNKSPNIPNDAKIITKIIDLKPEESESIEEFEMDPETARKNLDDAVKQTPRTKTSKKKDPFGKIITKIFRRKPDGKEEIVQEFIEDPKQTGKDIGDLDTVGRVPEEFLPKSAKDVIKKKPKKIIRIILRKPNGDESIQDLSVDPSTSPKELDKAVKDAIEKELSKIDDPKTKIISKVIDSKPGEEETTEEMEIDPEMARKNLDDAVKKAPRTKTSKKKDPFGKIITKIFRRKPDGKEEILREFVEDPKQTGKDIGDDDQPKPISESMTKITDPTGKTIIRIVRKMPDGSQSVQELIEEPEKKKDQPIEHGQPETLAKQKPESQKRDETVKPKTSDDEQHKKESKPVLEERKISDKPKDDDKKRPKKIIRIILRKPNGDEQIEDLLIDPDTKPEDINDTIKQELQNVLNKSPNIPNDAKIITKIIDLKPEESESIEEFEMDPETARKNLDDAVKQTPRTKTSKKKDSLGKIITKIFRRKPDGKEEILREFVEDPKQTGKDIGDDDQPKPVSESMTTITDPTGKTIIRIVRKMPDGSQSVQELIEEPEKKKDQPIEHGQPETLAKQKPESQKRDETVKPKPSDDEQHKKESKPVLEERKISDKPKDDDKKRPKKIIRIILRKPNGDEQIEDLLIDPDTKPEDINDTIKQELQNVLDKSPNISNDAKIITKIIDLKPGEEETTEEMETDPETARKNLDDAVKQTPRTKTSKKKDPFGKIITKIFRRKPDGKEEIVQEFVEDPKQTGKDIGDFDNIGRVPEGLKSIDPEFFRKSPKDVAKKPKKIIRIILRKPNGDESIQDLSVDPNTSPKDLDKAIKDAIEKELSKVDNPKTKIISKVIDSKPGEEETTEEMEIDPEIARKNLDDVVKKAPRTKTSKKKDPFGKIITKIFRRKPDGKEEILQEFVEDPKQTGKDIGDDDQPKPISESMTKITDPTGKTITRIVRKMPDGSQSVQEIIEEPETLVKQKPESQKDVEQKIKESKPVQEDKKFSDKTGVKPAKDDDKKRPKKIIRIILRKPNGDEQVEDLLIDPDTKPEDINDTIKQELQNVLNKSPNIPNDAKIITKIIDLKPGEEETTEEMETDPETARKNLDDAVKQTPRTKTSKKKDPFGKIITKIFRRKPDGKEEILQEFVEDPKQTGKDIGDDDQPKPISESMTKITDPTGKTITRIVRKMPDGSQSVQEIIEEPETLVKQKPENDDKKRPKKIIRIILRKPNGDEQVEDLLIDPDTKPEDINDTIKQELQNILDKSPNIPNDAKIITKIIDLKPGEEETTEEMETDPETARKNLDDAVKQTPRTKTSKKKDPFGKIITKIFRRKPDGKEEIVQEFVEDPKQTGKDIGDFDNIGRVPEGLKSIDPEFFGKSPKRPKKIIRIILRKPNGDESIQDLSVDQNTTPKDLDKMIKDAIEKELSKIDDPKTKIISKVIDSKPGEEETTEEFEMDPETARKNLDDAVKKAPRTKTSKKKDSLGKIITKIFRRKPDGKEEILREFVEDPKQTGKDIGDDDQPKPVSESMTTITDPTGKTIIRIVRKMPDGSQSVQELIEEPEKKHDDKPTLTTTTEKRPKDSLPSPKDTVDNVLGQFSDPQSKPTIKTLENVLTKQKPLDDISEGKKPSPTMEKPQLQPQPLFGSTATKATDDRPKSPKESLPKSPTDIYTKVLKDDKLPKQPEIIKRTALNEPESKPESKQPESTKSVMAISDDQTKIDPKSLSKFKDDLKDSDKLPGGQKLPVPRQTSRTSPEKPDAEQPESKQQQQPGVIVKDYKGNIVTEYMGKPDYDDDEKKRSTVITGKDDDEPITRAFSPDKDDDNRDLDRMIRKPEKPLVDEKITRAFSPDKDQEEELLLPSQKMEPLSKMMEKPEKISRAFEPQKHDKDDDDDWIQGLKSEILPSNIDDDDHQKPSQVKIESKKKSIDEPPMSTATRRISEPEPVEKLIDTGDDEPVEEFAIDPLKPGKIQKYHQ